MYWPIGAPNVYALSKHAISRANIATSHDGLKDETDGEGLLSPSKASRNGEKLDLPADGSSTPRSEERSTEDEDTEFDGTKILDAKISRGGSVFVTITKMSVTVWQTKPTVALANVLRSPRSIESYGHNTALLLRPDALTIAVQTAQGYLITYSVAIDPAVRVYHTVLPESSKHARRPSEDGYNAFRRSGVLTTTLGPGEGDGIREVNLRFRMVIRIDAGIGKALALEEELVVATRNPAALQCIRWTAENGVSQTSTELISRMSWVVKKSPVIEIVYDRPMNLMTWITNDGRAYAVQRRIPANLDPKNPKTLFQGFCFREPETEGDSAVKIAINARFSLIAVGCLSGDIEVYVVKDYTGNIPLSHKCRLTTSASSTGMLTCLIYSPDGHCLLAGYDKGWAMWSVYGKLGASSFGADSSHSELNDERWVNGITTAFWLGSGSELALLPKYDDRLWVLDIARNAATTCFSPANISRGILHSSTTVMIYKGHDVVDVTSLSPDTALWQTIAVPPTYLVHNWPIRVVASSSDGKYVAVAGRRGLAHYSVTSGRWRTFDDPAAENEFAVRGGMCWHHHVLVAAVESGKQYQLRLYSRDKPLDFSQIQHTEELAAPAISTTISGSDSLLVYTYDNILLHFIVVLGGNIPKLVQVGQIGFHGIIRAPPRVRAISWILPEDQLEHGDPSQDVATASVVFLVDGKLVLLQPSTNEQGEMKYDMRVVAQNVEWYMLLRDQPALVSSLSSTNPNPDTSNGFGLNRHLGHSLRDSLWYFGANGFNVWSDVQDVLACAPAELGRDLPPAVAIPVDFYPLSVVVTKGIICGIDAELVQRRDVNFGYFRQVHRTQLFLPQLLRYHLGEFNSPAALHLSSSYQRLPYFPHALEILLHDVLDAEVDHPPLPPETALLPTVLSFLSSFEAYLDVVVNCTRKTELRSWQTLFSYLPPVLDLFHDSLIQKKLSTAAGYLLVLHAFEQDTFHVQEFADIMRRAMAKPDWELCKELARFLVGIDVSGDTLNAVLRGAGLRDVPKGSTEAVPRLNAGGRRPAGAILPDQSDTATPVARTSESSQNQAQANGALFVREIDYFSMGQRLNAEDEQSYGTPEA